MATSATTSSTRADPVALTVLPYENQQTGFALGGPIVKDRLHWFFTYEHENNPATVFSQPPQLGGPSFTVASPTTQNSYLGRGDLQISPRDTLSMRGSHWQLENPFSLSGQTYPSLASILSPRSTNAAVTWSRVFTNNRVGQLLVGYNHFLSSTMPQPGVFGQPQYDFPGATMGAPFNYPSIEGTNTYQFRYNQTWTHDKHEFKFGGEYLKAHDSGTAYYSAFGRMTFLSLPSPAEMARRFPIDQWDNPAAWDLNGLDGIVQRFDLNSDAGAGDIPSWNYDVPAPHLRAVVRRRLAPQLEADGELRPALGRRLGRGGASGNHRELDPDRQRLHERRLRLRPGHLRSQELRAAGRLQLQRRRQERLRDPRRHRPVLRDASLERHLQPAALQPLHLLDLQQRRPAGLRDRPDPRRHRRRHPERWRAAAAADDANPLARFQDAVHLAVQRRLPEAARLGDGVRIRSRRMGLVSRHPQPRSQPVLRPGDRLQRQPEHAAGRTRSTGRSRTSRAMAAATTWRCRAASRGACSTTSRAASRTP